MFTVVFVLAILIVKNNESQKFVPNYSLNLDTSSFKIEDSLSNAKINFADSEKSVDVDKSPQVKIAIFDKLAKK